MNDLGVWQFALAVAGIVLANVIAIVAAYYGLKADNARLAGEQKMLAAAQKADNAKLAADVALSMLTERTDRAAADAAIKADLFGLITTAERHVEELMGRVTTLETGQDTWTKALRERTHELANKLHDLAMKVDRLERPRAPQPQVAGAEG